MNFFVKIYFENKRMKREINRLKNKAEENSKLLEEYRKQVTARWLKDKKFLAGCKFCVHAMPDPAPCVMTMKRICKNFEKIDKPFME